MQFKLVSPLQNIFQYFTVYSMITETLFSEVWIQRKLIWLLKEANPRIKMLEISMFEITKSYRLLLQAAISFDNINATESFKN